MDTQTMIRNLAWPAALVVMLLLSSCSAPRDSAAGEISGSGPPAVAPSPAPAPEAARMAAPATPVARPEANAGLPSQSLGVDKGRACRSDSDCAVKDAGSCCGYRPVCVSKDTPTFPEKVKAACANEGRVGICGFQSIDGCQCVAGKCEGVPMMENSVPLQ